MNTTLEELVENLFEVPQRILSNMARQVEELVRTGILAEQGDHRVFSENYAFTSPSAAGAMVTGRSCNGQLAWVVQGTSETYQAWEQRKLAERE